MLNHLKSITLNLFFYFILVSLLIVPEKVEAENYLFKQFSISEKFPPSIQVVHAEERSFVWIGTNNGLSKFDGYRLKEYTHQSNNPKSLPSKDVLKIMEDDMHNIWILTSNGLARYMNETDNFYIPKDTEGNNIQATSYCTISGGVVFARHNQLYIYEYATDKIQLLQKFKTSKDFPIHDIWQWDKQNLLCVNFWQGMFLLDIVTGKIKPTPFDNYQNINGILLSSKGHVWIAMYNKGLICLDRQGKELARYNTQNSDLSYDIILCMREHEGSILLGTDGGGINVLNVETGNIMVLEHHAGDRNSLPTNSIQSIHIDKNSNIWAGSVRGGLINIQKSFIKSYSDVTIGSCNGLSERIVLSFYEDVNSDKIWIGTDGGGINSFDKKKQTFTHYPSTWGEKITSISRYNDDELLVSIFSKKLAIFNKYTGTLRPIPTTSDEMNRLARYSRKTLNLYQDESSSVLILSTSVYRLDLMNMKLTKLGDESFEPTKNVLIIDHNAKYTYFYDQHHIYALNRSTNSIDKIYTDIQQQINCVTRDARGYFWIGEENGFYKYDAANDTKTEIKNYLLRNINTAVCDKNGHIWIGTNEMLLKWDIAASTLIAYGESDGAIVNKYIDKAVLKSSDGDVYMGGINGMVHISKTNTTHISSTPSLKLVDVISNGSSILASINMNKQNAKLEEDNKTLTVRIMAEEEDILRNKTYKFQINGRENLSFENKLPEITLYSLNHGTYTISASCTTRDGSWSPVNHILTFTIPPLWFQTWWFIVLCIIVISSLIILGIFSIYKHKKSQLDAALQKHTEQMYEEKVRFLININHELRTPLTLIHAPLNLLLNTLSPDEKNYNLVKSAFKQSKRIKKLLNMILNLRKMEVGASKLSLQLYQLNEWIEEIAVDYSYKEQEEQIVIKYDFDSAITDIYFDNEKHIIILTNLIDNAFKYSSQGSTLTLKTELVVDRQCVRISVIDNGNGIAEEDIEKLFERFHQGSTNKGGAGIGLSYAKILVEQHNGIIGAYNNTIGGACFYYELPLKQDTHEIISTPKEYLNKLTLGSNDDIELHESLVDRIDTQKYSLLFVDDNKELRDFISATLKDSFQNLYIASDGKEALDIVLKEIPDLVVSDIMMPLMNGYELCRAIKENQNINHIQVILLTARVDGQSQIEGYQIGADAYIEKPLEMEMLMATIRNRLFLRKQVRMRYTLNQQTIESDVHISSSNDTFLYKLNKIIIDNMENEKLDISYICQQIGMSRASLYNKLKALTDMGANDYINKLRMEKATSLLEQTNLNITELADQIGFSSPKYFSTVFKLYTGKTPTQYREELKTK